MMRLPNKGNTRPTLTRTAEVLKAMRKGARIESYPERPNLLRLVDRKGQEIPAWQTALKAAQAHNLAALFDAHRAHMARYKGHRHTLSTPCCGNALVVKAPTDPGDQWDSLMTCPHCGELFMKVATSTSARGLLPKGVHDGHH